VNPSPEAGTTRAGRPDMVGSRKPHQRVMIRQVATRLFQKQGYHATTMDDIAAATNLNKATVYHYYSNKHQLLFDIYSSGIDAILDRFATHDESAPAAAAIDRIVHDVVEAMAEDQSRTAVYYQERPFIERWFPAEGYAELRSKETAYGRHVQRTIQRGINDGTFKDVDARAAALALLSAAGQTYSWYRPTSGLSVRQIGDLLATLFLGGLIREPQPAAPQPAAPQPARRRGAARAG
jgi:TetR/AcrR family transcriptional regulator, cholesterol catabolism regulator